MQTATINTTNNTGMHCKVSCNNQYRRFLFVGTEFSSLFSQVQQLLSLNREFVLKYKDNEGDLITISSNEELVCALSYSEAGVLRLTAVVRNDAPLPTTVPEPSTEFPGFNFHGKHGGKCHGRGRHGFGQIAQDPETPGPSHGRGHHGPGHFAQDLETPGFVPCHGRGHHGRGLFAQDPEAHGFGPSHGRGRHGCSRFAQDPDAPRFGPEAFKSKLTFKRDLIQSHLAELAKGELNPDQQYRQEMLQGKLRKIESRLAKFEEGGCQNRRWAKHACKWEAKEEKHRNKEEKKMKTEEYGQTEKQEKGKIVLSEETQAKIVALKTQIHELKPGIKEVKYQLKAKKVMMKEAKAKGGNVEQLANEIAQLKAVRKAHKIQVRPLKEQIRALKHT